MSTTAASEQGVVFLLDDEDTIVKKVKSSVTDSGRDVVRGPDKPGISNLIEVMAVVTERTPEVVEGEFDGAGYGDFKAAAGEAIAAYLAPLRERYLELRADEAALEQGLAEGAGKARAISSATLARVRERMGVGTPV